MSPLVLTEPKYRREEEEENSRQGCLVCAAGTEVRGRARLWVFRHIKPIIVFVAGTFSPPCSRSDGKREYEEVAGPLKINELWWKKEWPQAANRGRAAGSCRGDNVNKETTWCERGQINAQPSAQAGASWVLLPQSSRARLPSSLAFSSFVFYCFFPFSVCFLNLQQKGFLKVSLTAR